MTERKQLLKEEKDKAESIKGSIANLPEPKVTKTSKYNITPVPPLLDALYPNDAVCPLPEKTEHTRIQWVKFRAKYTTNLLIIMDMCTII